MNIEDRLSAIEIEKRLRNNELIDVEIKGNLVRLYLGKNGDQWGDDWDNKPYEHNAEMVYWEFIEKIADIAINFEFEVSEPADVAFNSDFSREDFIEGEIYAFMVKNPKNNSSAMFYFGDEFKYILERIGEIKAAHNIYIPEIDYEK